MIEIKTTVNQTPKGIETRGRVARDSATELEEELFERIAIKVAEACNEFSQAHNGTHLMVQTDTRPK